MIVVAKIGTSSLTDATGHIRLDAVAKLCAEVATVRAAGHQVVVVSSGAVGAGLPAMGFLHERPRDILTLQALSAVGQSRLMAVYNDALAVHGLVGGQLLLTPYDFYERSQYLHARGTLSRLLELGAVPIINENDAIADDEIRFGDNDRIAALVAQLLDADLLVLLTDTPGLLTADPRRDPGAALVEEISEVTPDLERLAGGAGSDRGSGGMASKLQAAKMAAWSGISTVIGSAERPDLLLDAVNGVPGTGTRVVPAARRLPARKLWIAFALEPRGRLTLDEGAVRAVVAHGRSLLAVGVKSVVGEFERREPVEVCGPDGAVVARGLAAVSSSELRGILGQRTGSHPEGTPDEVIHRDELVILS
jgi:glutamate 5-kinase